MIVRLKQPTNQVCWATVYALMRSWKDQAEYGIEEAAGLVGRRYGEMVARNQGMPPSEFGTFIALARMQTEPMSDRAMDDYESLLRSSGLLWVGTLFAVSGHDLHSRIIVSISGNGSPGGTSFGIVDPWTGMQYSEPFTTYIAKYEGALKSTRGQYFQIRHY